MAIVLPRAYAADLWSVKLSQVGCGAWNKPGSEPHSCSWASVHARTLARRLEAVWHAAVWALAPGRQKSDMLLTGDEADFSRKGHHAGLRWHS